MKVEKLASVTLQSIRRLEDISFAPSPNRPRWCRLLRHDLLPSDIDLLDYGICPDCVNDLGYVEAHWHLRLMCGCPLHGRRALRMCPHCSEGISWYRPDLLECKCGKVLCVDEQGGFISSSEASLLDILRCKVLRIEIDADNPASLPRAELYAAPLRTIIVVIRVLGKHRLLADGRPGKAPDGQLLTAAAEVLCEWPRNFFRLLRDLAGKGALQGGQSLRRGFGSILDAFCKNKTIEVRSDVNFIFRAFMEYAEREQDGAIIDPRLLRQYQSIGSTQMTSLAEISKKLRIQPRAARRLLKAQSVPVHRVKHGRSSRYLIDASTVSFMTDSGGKILRIREAAKILGLPVTLLKSLRQAKVFKDKHIAPGRPGFHSHDVDQFARSITLKMISETSSTRQTTRLTRVRDVGGSRAHANPLRIRLLDAIISGRVSIHGPGDGTVGGALLEASCVEEFVADLGQSLGESGLTREQTADQLGCDPGAIRDLLQHGHLRVLHNGVTLDPSSVSQFHGTYVALSTLAKKWGTSSRSLAAQCQRVSIPNVQAAVGANRGPQCFILRSDVPVLSAGRMSPRETTIPQPSRHATCFANAGCEEAA